MIFTILDIETTGLKKHSDDILEVGYIQTNENCQLLRSGVFYFYKDEFNIESDAQRVHGLTREFLSGYKNEFDASLTKLYTLFRRGIIVGKNSTKFDIPFIQIFLKRYESGLSDVNCRDSIDLQTVFTPVYRKWYEKMTGNNPGRKLGTLEELMEVIGYTDEQVRSMFKEQVADDRSVAHNALYDTFMTYLLFKEAVHKRYINLNNYGQQDLSEQEVYESVKAMVNECVAKPDEYDLRFVDAFYQLQRYYREYKDCKVSIKQEKYTQLMYAFADGNIGVAWHRDAQGRVIDYVVAKNLTYFVSEFLVWLLLWYTKTGNTDFLSLATLYCKANGYMSKPVNITKVFSFETARYMNKSNPALYLYLDYACFQHNCYGKDLPVISNRVLLQRMMQGDSEAWREGVITIELIVSLLIGKIECNVDSVSSILGVISLREVD